MISAPPTPAPSCGSASGAVCGHQKQEANLRSFKGKLLVWRQVLQNAVHRGLLLLDNVADTRVQDADFARVTIDRQNERFEDVLRFCRLLLSSRTPTVQAGRRPDLLGALRYEQDVRAFRGRLSAPLRAPAPPRGRDSASRGPPHHNRHRGTAKARASCLRSRISSWTDPMAGAWSWTPSGSCSRRAGGAVVG